MTLTQKVARQAYDAAKAAEASVEDERRRAIAALDDLENQVASGAAQPNQERLQAALCEILRAQNRLEEVRNILQEATLYVAFADRLAE